MGATDVAGAALRAEFAQPLPVVNHWGAAGLPLTAAFLWSFALVALAYVACGALLVAARPAASAQRRRIIAAVAIGAVASTIAAASFPAVFSADTYAYALYGELAERGADPYAPPPMFDAATPLDRAIVAHWSANPPPSHYGPGFVALARGVVDASSPFGGRAVLIAFRAVAVLSFALCCALVFALARRCTPADDILGFALFALNPTVIWSAVEGHNDALMMAFVLGAVLLLRNGRAGFAGALLALSALVKAPGLLAVLAVPHAVRNVRFSVAFACGAACVAAGYVLFARGLPPAQGGDVFGPGFSLQGGGRLIGALLSRDTRAPEIGAALGLLPGVALGVWGAIRALRGDRAGAIVVAIGLWLLVPNPYPWYATWLLPAVLFAPRSPWAAALVGLSLGAVSHYLFDAVDGAVEIWLMPESECAAVAASVGAWLIARTVRRRDIAVIA